MIAILSGPTATGKTGISLEFAERSRGGIEIINADSMLVYRGLNIGTAKPSKEELSRVRHHLIDIREPDEPFTAGDFVREAEKAMADIESRGKRALIVGGTGFYLKALLYGMWEGGPADKSVREELEKMNNGALYEALMRADEKAASRIGPADRYRLIRALEVIRGTGKTLSELEKENGKLADPRFKLLVIDREKAELDSRISERTQAMLGAGIVEETKMALEKYPHARALTAVGYRQVIEHLEGRLPRGRKVTPGLDGLRSEIELATRQLVKRQRTWFRGEKASEWFLLERDRAKVEEVLGAIHH